jgi:hypothetical protein
VPSAPGHLLIHTDQTCLYPSDGVFTGLICRGHVKIDAARQIKAPCHGSGDYRG